MVLAGSLDYEATLADVAKLAVPQIGDWCAVDMLGPAEPGPAGPAGPDAVIRRLAVAHVDPSKVQMAWDLLRRYPIKANDPRNSVRACSARAGANCTRRFPTRSCRPRRRDAAHLELLRSAGLERDDRAAGGAGAGAGGDHFRQRRDRPAVRAGRPVAGGGPGAAGPRPRWTTPGSTATPATPPGRGSGRRRCWTRCWRPPRSASPSSTPPSGSFASTARWPITTAWAPTPTWAARRGRFRESWARRSSRSSARCWKRASR